MKYTCFPVDGFLGVVRMKLGRILPAEEGAEGCRLQSDEDVEAIVVEWFQEQPREFFMEWNQGVLPHLPSGLF
jgi:hypothetical protein